MTLLVIQVGQCGNQVGTEFWRCVSAQLAAAGRAGASASLAGLVQQLPSERAGGDAVPSARCLLVDAEPKAVRSCAASEPLLARAPAVCGQSGRGSCWAHGYRQPGEPGGGGHGGDADRALLRLALDAVRRELERCPSAPDVLLVHGLGGGTGGGLGCRLLEELRRTYGELFIACASVAPRSPGGDTSLLAPLGTVLCVQFLQRYADAVLLFQNGELVLALERAARQGGASLPRVALPDVNKAVGLRLAAALVPTDAAPAAAVRDIVAAVCPVPSRRFVEVHTAVAANSAFETDAQAWASVASSLAAAVPRHDSFDGNRAISSTASMLLLRGVGDADRGAAGDVVVRALIRSGAWPHVAWQPESASVTVRCAARPLSSAPPRSLTVVSNRSSAVGQLRAVAEGAEQLLASGAYLHWFEKFDVSRDALRDALETTHAIVAEYRDAHGHS